MIDETQKTDKLSKEGQKIKDLLAEFLGAEADDINLTDSFSDSLHMKPMDISDFLNIVKENGFELGDTDITELTLVSDLIEAVESNNLSE